MAKPKAIAPLIQPAKKVIPLSLISKEKIFNLKILRIKDIPYTAKNLPTKTNKKTKIIKDKQKESWEIEESKKEEKEEEIKIDTSNVEPDEEELENPIRILPLQKKFIKELNNNDFEPLRKK